MINIRNQKVAPNKGKSEFKVQVLHKRELPPVLTQTAFLRCGWLFRIKEAGSQNREPRFVLNQEHAVKLQISLSVLMRNYADSAQRGWQPLQVHIHLPFTIGSWPDNWTQNLPSDKLCNWDGNYYINHHPARG